MKLLSRNYYIRHGIWSVLLAITLLSSSPFSAFAWQRPKAPVVASKRAAATLTAIEKKAAAKIKLETIREVTAALSSAEFEGRGTGQPGADKAANYLAQRFAKLGLKPGGENGSYLQQIKFRSAEVLPESSVKIGDVVLNHGSDYVVLPPYGAERVDVSGGVVFAGYGVVSPELKRDDLAGLDLKDKVVIIIGGEPAGVDTTAWKRATSSQVRAMNIFTRGAAAMIVANLDTQERSFKTIADYLSRRRVSLASAPAMMFKVPPVLLAGNEAMERVFAGSPVTFAQTLEKAQAGEVVSRDLEKTAAIALRFKLQETTSSNVVAVLEGSDPKLKQEAVVYSAHYDAYGIEGDGRIFPGAADNALGVATVVAIAEGLVTAFPKPSTHPRRSTVFLAVTGEEYGLFGAEYWVKHPTWQLQKVAANINFDGIGTEVYGPVKRIVGFGAEHSDLGKIFEDVTVAAGDMVAPDPMPEENAFVRSDHYAFVKQGVPALMLMGVPAGDESMWLPRARKWLETDYHSPNDTIKPDWDWTGPQTLAKVGLIIGLRIANAETMPAWKTTSPFNRLRAQAKAASQ